MKRGCDAVIVEARVCRNVVKLLPEYYMDNIPGYGRLYAEALNVFSEYGIVKYLIMFVDDIGDESSTTNEHNTIGNTYSTVSIPQIQKPESTYIQKRVREIQQLSS